MPVLRILSGCAVVLSGAACTTVSIVDTRGVQTSTVAGGRVEAQVQARPAPVPAGELLPLENWSATLVTAKAVPRLGEVRDLSDAFTFEGRIYAHVTFVAGPGVRGGEPEVEMRWLRDGQLVHTQKARLSVSRSPYYSASSVSGTVLGVGRASVEVVVNGKAMASREFTVVEK